MSMYSFISKLPRGMNLHVALTLLSGILIALLLLPAGVFASSPGSGFTFGTSQALDQAAVSVVRLTATYNVIPPISGCASSSTGLGVMVGSGNATQDTTNFTNWILSDGSLINTNGIACGIGGKARAQLASIQIYANTAFTSQAPNPLLKSLECHAAAGSSICTDGTFPEALKCQNGSDCSLGVVLIPFHTSVPLPVIQVAQQDQSTPVPAGIELTGASFPPTVAQVTAALTPAEANIANPQNEPGMPIVNSSGQLLDMNLHLQDDPAGTIRSYVSTTLQTVQSNVLQSNWDTGVNAYYAKNYPAARQAFQNAGRPNPQFKAPAAFLALPIFISSTTGDRNRTPTAGGTKTPVSGSQQNANTISVFGLQIPGSSLIWYVIAGIILLVILLIVISLLLVRRQSRHREELARFEEEAQRVSAKADADAQRMAKQETQQRQEPVPVRRAANLNSSQVKLACPNCGTAVQPGDNFCPNCRMPLALSDSGLNVRLAKPAAVPTPQETASPAPAGVVPSSAVYEQPTMEMPPSVQRNGQIDTEKTVPFKAPPLPTSAPSPESYIGNKLSLVVGTRSNPGIKRQHKPNEDSLFAAQGERTLNSNPEQFGLFVVADGMGGHANGQDASRLAIQTIVDRLMPKLSSSEHFSDDAYIQMLVEGVQEANQAVHQRNIEHRADMGTTMTAALVVGTTAFVANVGDSRTYLYREPEGLKKITNDHSVVASLVEAGIIKPDDIYTHPKRNQIYRSLGEKPVIDVDSFKVPLRAGDKLLLCSDGLWDMVRDPIIQNVLQAVPDPSQTGNALIKAALDGGGEDNVSVIVVSVTEATTRTGMTGIQLLARPDAPQYPPMK